MWILALFIELIVVLGCAFYASKDFNKVLSENIEAAGQKVASFTYCIVITFIIQGLFAFALMPWLKNILFKESDLYSTKIYLNDELLGERLITVEGGIRI